MNFFKSFFPLSFKFKSTKEFVFTIILYAAFAVVTSIIFGFLARIRFVGLLFSTTGFLSSVYATGGIVVAILHKTNVIK